MRVRELCLAAALVASGPSVRAEERTLYLFDDLVAYPWSGFMGERDGASLTIDHRSTDTPFAGSYATRLALDGSESWAGVWVQVTDSAWFGPGTDLSGAVRLTFALRGSPVGASVDVLGFNDQLVGIEATLTDDWQLHTVDLAGLDLANVWNLFGVATEGSPKTIEIDEVSIVFEREPGTPVHVEVTGEGAPDWGYALTVDGREQFVRGIGYDVPHPSSRHADDFARMREAGFDTLRLWSQADVSYALLDRAAEHGLRVIVGFWLPRSRESGPTDYTDPSLRAAVRRSLAQFVDLYADHPAVLMWSVGNEVLLALAPDTEDNRAAVGTLIGEMAADLHALDPHHPVTYASAYLLASSYVCDTELDLFGANAFGNTVDLLLAYPLLDCDKPVVVLEYGCDGWWERDWSDYDDATRARDYGERALAIETSRGLTVGGAAFAWADKTEGPVEGPLYTGWGLADADGRPRLQLRAVETAQRAGRLGDAHVRLHLDRDRYCPGEPMSVHAFVAHPGPEPRAVDLVHGIASGAGAYFHPDWTYRADGWDATPLTLAAGAFESLETLAAPAPDVDPLQTSAFAALTEPGTTDVVGGMEGRHDVAVELASCPAP